MIYLSPGATDTGLPAALWQNVLAQGALTASSETADGFAANAIGPQTYDYWTPSAVPAWLAVTLAASTACDCAAIVAHDLGSKGATVKVQRWTGSAWADASSAVTPTDDSTILIIFPEASATQWRLYITGAVASIGVAMIGKRLIFPRGVQPTYTPLHLAKDIELLGGTTMNGQFIGNRVIRRGKGTSIPLAPLPRAWVEATARGFIDHYDDGQPFVWASIPVLFPEDVGYCWRSGGTLSPAFDDGAFNALLSLEVSAHA